MVSRKIKQSFQVNDPELQALVYLVPGVLNCSRANNTITKYECYFKQWVNWCNRFQEIVPLPAKIQHIILFIVASVQQAKSYPVIESTLMAIKYFHSVSGHALKHSKMLEHVLEAAKRLVGKSAIKKEPVTVDMLRRMVKVLSTSKNNLKSLRLTTILLTSFAGFLRFSECVNLRRSDIKFFATHAVLFIEKSKTDIYRVGHWLHLARLDSDLCPVNALERYCRKIKEQSNSDNFIFRALTSAHKLRRINKSISYSSIRDQFKTILSLLGYNKALFGLHSLRSGGVTAAANLGIKDRLLMKHGRWKSANIKNNYISENLGNLLFVSKNLGL